MNTTFSKDVHPVQRSVLLELALFPGRSFADLNISNLPTDWFSFHLRQVIKNGWVEKLKDKTYVLTTEGKKLYLQLEEESALARISQRLSVLLVVKDNGKYLVQEREVEPFRGYWEFPTKRIPFGDSPLNTAKKTLKNEAGLEGEFNYIGILHKVEKNENNDLFDDKYYLVFTVDKVSGNFIDIFNHGKNFWLTEKEFREKELLHFDLESTFELLSKGKSYFVEVTGKIGGY